MKLVISSEGERKQLRESIDKLFHYLLSYVRYETKVEIMTEDGDEEIYSNTFKVPSRVVISSSLYTRLDDCHGAGNCCRVPFDLVYTDYDYRRILNFDIKKAAETFGVDSANGFALHRGELLDTLVRLTVCFTQYHVGISSSWSKDIYVKQNTKIFSMSGNKSCPHLIVGGDRYFCGVHPFKPLHCWYPHMVVRKSSDDNSISIGRMQYGRNHKFGCPVLFKEASEGGIFDTPGTDSESYFISQFQSDYEKLDWTSKSAESLGFNEHGNYAVSLSKEFMNSKNKIQMAIASGKDSIPLWEK